jgi:gluconolactonase
MKKPMTVLAEGLGHPEGPYPLPDGRVVFANSYKSEIGVWDPKKKGFGTYAFTGGAPNACMLGSDGKVYYTGGINVGSWLPEQKRPACIARATPEGKIEIVATEADGVKFDGPNDLSFGPDGKLYFTDSGDWDAEKKPHKGRIIVIEKDGKAHILDELDHTYPNGIVVEPDGSVVWVESYTLKMIRRRSNGKKELLHTFKEKHIPDGFKIDSSGNFWVTTVTSNGIDVVGKDGKAIDFLETGGVPLNCVFGGTSLYVADFGTFDTTGPIPMNGRLVKYDVGVAGMKLFTGAIK